MRTELTDKIYRLCDLLESELSGQHIDEQEVLHLTNELSKIPAIQGTMSLMYDRISNGNKQKNVLTIS